MDTIMKTLLLIPLLVVLASPVEAKIISVRHIIHVKTAPVKTEPGGSSLPHMSAARPSNGGSSARTDWESVKVAIAKTARQHGILPAVAVGQAANESMHGRSSLSAKYYNYFGIKGVGTAGSVDMWTTECAARQCFKTKATFAAYKSPQDSIDAYVRLVSKMLGDKKPDEPIAQLTKIWKAGYATSYAYVQHVSAVQEFQDYNY